MARGTASRCDPFWDSAGSPWTIPKHWVQLNKGTKSVIEIGPELLRRYLWPSEWRLEAEVAYLADSVVVPPPHQERHHRVKPNKGT